MVYNTISISCALLYMAGMLSLILASECWQSVDYEKQFSDLRDEYLDLEELYHGTYISATLVLRRRPVGFTDYMNSLHAIKPAPPTG